MAHTVFIRGIPQLPDVAARNTPGLQGTTVLFRPAKETQAQCTETKPDPNGDNFNGQVYKWLHLTFADGRSGWVRDDLLDLQGDCTAFGYGVYDVRTWAFTAPVTASTTTSPATTPAATSATPTTPTPPVATPAATTPQAVAPTVPAAPAVQPGTPCTASVRGEIRAKMRSAPSLSGVQLALIDPKTPIVILHAFTGTDDPSFKWLQTTVNGVTGYLREDLLDYTGDCSSLGLLHGAATTTQVMPVVTQAQPSPAAQPPAAGTLLPAPVHVHYSIFQEFGGMAFGQPHKGTDLDIPVGTPLFASAAGTVAYLRQCSKCTPAQPNFQSQGLQSWDSKAINDPTWGYGFGNAVIVRYAYNVLPDSMRAAMDSQGLTNGYAYVIYGHMSHIDVAPGTVVQAGTQIGLSGNTGNSTGPHLHLEVRMSTKGTESDTYGRPVINPRTMFQL
jgi:hypothetical protein